MREGSLVLYKNRPARVRRVGDRLDIELEDGQLLKVRAKDVSVLHPGPLRSLAELEPPPGEVQAAWELLAGGQTTLPELAELAYGAYTPATAWAAWQLVDAGLYFSGSPDDITANTAEQVAHKQAALQAEAGKAQAWAEFLERARAGYSLPGDEVYLREVEGLALERAEKSRLLRELGRAESPENAHALLLQLGYWDACVNPYPRRLGLPGGPPDLALPDMPDETRVDLTHLAAFAIDDEDTLTPDDAVSLDGSRLWVHVADPAAVVWPDSPLDLEARARGATLHLPEQIIPMLPESAIQRLGLGLGEISPALSFGLEVGADGPLAGTLDIQPSWVRVTRLTYEQVEACIEQEPFRCLDQLAQAYEAGRREQGAISIELPEVKLRVQDGQVSVHPLPPLRSRALVREAMLMAGQAVARLALEWGLAVPFVVHEPPPTDERPADLAGMYALRRLLKRSQYKTTPGRHAGLGLEPYVQLTSPLRRYLDLVVHQQLRTRLAGREPLDVHGVLERIGAAEAVGDSVSQAERLSYEHWILVYLSQHPGWRGQAIVVGKRDSSGVALIPELGYEARVRLPAERALNDALQLALAGVNLPFREAHFKVVG